MKISKLIAVGLLFAMISSSPASALFGSECRKSKDAYSKEIYNAKKLKKAAYAVTPQEKAAHYLRQREQAKASLKTCLENRNTMKDCKLWSEISMSPSKMPLFYQEKMAQANARFNTAYRIVLNNQKCFDPIIVVDAQRFLGK